MTARLLSASSMCKMDSLLGDGRNCAFRRYLYFLHQSIHVPTFADIFAVFLYFHAPNSDSAGLGDSTYAIEGDIEQALEQQTVMRQQLKETEAAEAAAAEHEHQEDLDVVMSDANKKRKLDEILSISETTSEDAPLKKATLEGVAHPSEADAISGDGVGDGTSTAQAVDLDEVVVVDGRTVDVVILD